MEGTHAVLDIGRLCDGRGHWRQRVRAPRLKSTLVSRIKSLHCCRYEATFKYSALTVPIIMLAALWLLGLALLVTQQRRLRAGRGLSLQGVSSVEMVDVGRPTGSMFNRASSALLPPPAVVKGAHEKVNPRRFVWAFYVCFVAG